jgi:hypothetical protein
MKCRQRNIEVPRDSPLNRFLPFRYWAHQRFVWLSFDALYVAENTGEIVEFCRCWLALDFHDICWSIWAFSVSDYKTWIYEERKKKSTELCVTYSFLRLLCHFCPYFEWISTNYKQKQSLFFHCVTVLLLKYTNYGIIFYSHIKNILTASVV